MIKNNRQQTRQSWLQKILHIPLYVIVLAFFAFMITVILFYFMIAKQWLWQLPVYYAMPDPYDSVAEQQWQIEQLKKTSIPQTLHVIVLGGSSIQHSLFDQHQLSKTLSQKLGADVQLINLAYNAQRFQQMLGVLEELNFHTPGVLIIGMTPDEFATAPDSLSESLNGKIGYAESNLLLKFLQVNRLPLHLRSGGILANYAAFSKSYFSTRAKLLFSYKSFCEQNAFGLFRPVCLQYYSHFWNRFKIWSMVFAAKRYQSLQSAGYFDLQDEMIRAQQAHRFKQYQHINTRIFNLLIKQAQLYGYHIILLGHPYLPTSYKKWDSILQDYNKIVKNIMMTNNIPYWNLDKDINFELTKDFFDFTHLSISGKIKFQQALQNKLITYLKPLLSRQNFLFHQAESIAGLILDKAPRQQLSLSLYPWQNNLVISSPSIYLEKPQYYSVDLDVTLKTPAAAKIGVVSHDNKLIASTNVSGWGQHHVVVIFNLQKPATLHLVCAVDDKPIIPGVIKIKKWQEPSNNNPFALSNILFNKVT